MSKKIAIIAGGDSPEWVISVQSADMVANEMLSIGYEAYVVKIRDKKWQVLENNQLYADIDKNDFSFIKSGSKFTFDCALIAIHGTPGEDGKLQAYFELIGMPYTTCGVLASALTFNKHVCKVFLKDYGIKSAKAILLNRIHNIDIQNIINELGLPCFVKPNESGSSFGVTKVESENQLQNAIKEAFKEGEEVIIEQQIVGTEVTSGLAFVNGNEYIFPITEVISKKGFFDYEAKYTPGMSEEITPARISNELTQEVKNTSATIYKAIGCKGIVRIDYIISNNELFFLEVNTVPGMSPNSIVPKQLREMGSSLADMYKLIIDEVCIR